MIVAIVTLLLVWLLPPIWLCLHAWYMRHKYGVEHPLAGIPGKFGRLLRWPWRLMLWLGTL